MSANFVIPYPPGFPIMVPGQVIDAETIGFMRKLDVKEIHGYNADAGPQTDQAVSDSPSAIRREKHGGAWPTPRRVMRAQERTNGAVQGQVGRQA